MIELKKEVIKYAQKLNSTNLSPLRSGNVSVRATQDGVEGFLLTPSGKMGVTGSVTERNPCQFFPATDTSSSSLATDRRFQDPKSVAILIAVAGPTLGAFISARSEEALQRSRFSSSPTP